MIIKRKLAIVGLGAAFLSSFAMQSAIAADFDKVIKIEVIATKDKGQTGAWVRCGMVGWLDKWKYLLSPVEKTISFTEAELTRGKAEIELTIRVDQRYNDIFHTSIRCETNTVPSRLDDTNRRQDGLCRYGKTQPLYVFFNKTLPPLYSPGWCGGGI